MAERLRAGLQSLRSILADEKRRVRFQFAWIFMILGGISAVMTVVNIITGKTLLMWSTLIFALLCAGDFGLSRLGERGLRASRGLLSVEIIALFTFFLVSGEPEGFAAIWTCLLPPSAMVLYRRRGGTAMSAVMLGILIVLLWLPVGKSLCFFEYTASFRLRFPFLYCASFLISLFLEFVREVTQSELEKSQAQFEHLCNFDRLTGLNNRFGFDRGIERYMHGAITCLMADIDKFKEFNDTFGHAAGDVILRDAGEIFRKTLGEEWLIARWGGEEFLAAADGKHDPAEAAKKLCEAFRGYEFVLPGGRIEHVTISVGAVRSEGGENIDAIAMRADDLLYKAKQNGRDGYVAE